MAKSRSLGRTLYGALAVTVVGAIVASTAVLIAAIAISSSDLSKPPISDGD